jgi:hypothetical protein
MYFSESFDVDPSLLSDYGAFNISLLSDLPLFIDPFLLFHSQKPEYQRLHATIIRYLTFLRDKSVEGDLDAGLLKSWYHFKEVKQNWLGFTVLGNGGHALGADFAASLNQNLEKVFRVTEGSALMRGRHLEKMSLLKGGIGRDGISDFTTNLIKGFLLEYTQTFAAAHIDESMLEQRNIQRVRFNYTTEVWENAIYKLPIFNGDFVLLTPVDLLTRDENWINRTDLVRGFDIMPAAIGDEELRSLVSNYFQGQLKARRPGHPSKKERDHAANATIDKFPQLLDYYIALKELDGDNASRLSEDRVDDVDLVFVEQLQRAIEDIARRTEIYRHPQSSYEEALFRVRAFKQYVENQDGYKLINRNGEAFSREDEVQLFFGLAFVGTRFDLNREPNNGRGPVDFKVSSGAYDKSLVEFKLGSNSQLKRNLEKQVAIYEKANQTLTSPEVV